VQLNKARCYVFVSSEVENHPGGSILDTYNVYNVTQSNPVHCQSESDLKEYKL